MSIGGKSKNENMLRNLRNCVPITGPVTNSLSTYLSQFTEFFSFFFSNFFFIFSYFFPFPPHFFHFFFIFLFAVNKQINDKERIAAAMENPNLREIVENCIMESDSGWSRKLEKKNRVPTSPVWGSLRACWVIEKSVPRFVLDFFEIFFLRKRIFDGVKALSELKPRVFNTKKVVQVREEYHAFSYKDLLE